MKQQLPELFQQTEMLNKPGQILQIRNHTVPERLLTSVSHGSVHHQAPSLVHITTQEVQAVRVQAGQVTTRQAIVNLQQEVNTIIQITIQEVLQVQAGVPAQLILNQEALIQAQVVQDRVTLLQEVLQVLEVQVVISLQVQVHDQLQVIAEAAQAAQANRAVAEVLQAHAVRAQVAQVLLQESDKLIICDKNIFNNYTLINS